MCALIGVPCRLRMLSIFSTFDNMLKMTTSPQAKRAETDPRQGSPRRAHLQPPDECNNNNNTGTTTTTNHNNNNNNNHNNHDTNKHCNNNTNDNHNEHNHTITGHDNVGPRRPPRVLCGGLSNQFVCLLFEQLPLFHHTVR